MLHEIRNICLSQDAIERVKKASSQTRREYLQYTGLEELYQELLLKNPIVQ